MRIARSSKRVLAITAVESAPVTTAAAPSRAARLSGADLRRIMTIFWRLGPLVVSFLRDRRRWVRWGDPTPRSEAFHARRAERLVATIASLGAGFVKIAQILATRADLIPEPYLSALGTLTDRVPPERWDVIRETISSAWGAAPESMLDSIDSTPLAAGSLGQVHRARYRGRDVVVKVLRPRVEAIVAQDTLIARWGVDWMYARFPHYHVLGMRVVLDEFARHVPDEMNFEREATQCALMRARFADEPRLRIPRVEHALTRRTVLVMEYLVGDRIDALSARVARGDVDPRRLIETLIECYARMMLRDGVFHADPHPGNLLVDAKGRIVLLDFGMVIDVSVATRKALFDAIVSAVRQDVDALTDDFFSLGLVAPGTSRETIRALVIELLAIAYSEGAVRDRAQLFAERVMRELFAWPIVLPGELVYFARTAALIEGIGARYDATFNSIKVASPIAMRLRGELLRALVGDASDDPIMSIAATAGALAGGARALFGNLTRGLRERWG